MVKGKVLGKLSWVIDFTNVYLYKLLELLVSYVSLNMKVSTSFKNVNGEKRI